MTTQRDIALRAKVSQMTVSLALRDAPTIPEATRRRIRQVAARMNYRPDPLVSALMRQRKKTGRNRARAKIVFLHENPQDPAKWISPDYATGCFYGAREIALQRGYLFEAFYADRRHLSGSRLSQILWTQNVQGLLIAPMPIAAPLDVDWPLFATVSLDYSHSSLNVHRVIDDHAAGMTKIVSHICELGFRRPALVIKQSGDDRTNHHRLGSFLAHCVRQPSLAAIPPFIYESDGWNEAAFLHWLRSHQPDVVVAGDKQVVQTLEARGKDVPPGLEIVLYHKDRQTKHHRGLVLDASYVGKVAAQVLISMIENNQRGLPAVPTTTYVDATQWEGRLPAGARLGKMVEAFQ